jgi:hypothetical protein
VSNWYDPGTGDHLIVDGNIVERDALRIAEAIKDYDQNLELLCLNPERATGITDEPFVIAERGKDGVLRPVLRAWVLDEQILQRLYNSDTQRLDVFNALVSMEEQRRRASQQRYQEQREEAKDVVKHIAGMKSRYTVRDSITGDMLTFYDDRPAERH